MIIDCAIQSYSKYGHTTRNAVQVQCDFCRTNAAAPGESIDAAVDNARNAGYITRPGAHPPISPRKWCCRMCQSAS